MDQWRCDSNLSTRPLKGRQTPAHPQALRTITGGHHSNSPITRTTAGTAHSRHARATIGNDRNLLARKTHGIAHNRRALETTGNTLRTTAAIARNPRARKTTGSRHRTTGNAHRTTAAIVRTPHARKTTGSPRRTTCNALRTTAAIVRNPHARKTTGSRRRINGNVRTTAAVIARKSLTDRQYTTARAPTKRHTPPHDMKRPIPNERMMPPTFNPDWPTTKQ